MYVHEVLQICSAQGGEYFIYSEQHILCSLIGWSFVSFFLLIPLFFFFFLEGDGLHGSIFRVVVGT